MNILVVGKKYVESFALHVSETFVDMGHNVIHFNPGINSQISKSVLRFRINQLIIILFSLFEQTKIGRLYEQRRLKNILNKNEIELVVCCNDFLFPNQISWIKDNYKCKIVLWFPDAVSQFKKGMFLDSHFDFLFFKDLFIVDILKNELGLNAYYLPECCNPKYHKKILLSELDLRKYECDISTAGNMHTARARLFKKLNKYKVKLWGNPAPIWMDTKGLDNMIQNHFVSNHEKSKAFIASKIVVNNFYPSEILGSNARLFEVAATGSFQICSYRDSLNELYEIDKEIVTFKTPNELFSKIDFYLEADELRKEIADRAYEKTLTQHTYEIRLTKMLEIVFS